MNNIKILVLVIVSFFQKHSLLAQNNVSQGDGAFGADSFKISKIETDQNKQAMIAEGMQAEVNILRKEIIDLQKKHIKELEKLKDSHQKEIILLNKRIQAMKHNSTFDSLKDQKLQKKLSEIKLPEIAFFNAPLPEVMIDIARQSRRFDFKEKEISQKGVNIITKQNSKEPFPLINITLNSMELGKSLRFLTEMVGWKYEINNGVVYVQKFSEMPSTEFLETGIYELDQKTIDHLIRLGGGAGSQNYIADPFAPKPVKKGKVSPGLAIKTCFERHGVVFRSDRGDKFIFDGFQILVKSDKICLDAIENIINRVKKFP